VDEHLEELERLADTAGAVVVGELMQQLDRPHPATYLGKGKIEELRVRIDEKDATLLIFDDELSPAQGRNIEQATGKRVMDRAELILDIFATRARTAEAKMQVELAQLEYTLPRLTRMWTHLEKFRGGIGMRGPGETQLETDRRLINHRIKVLKERLTEVQRSREVQRQSRKATFRASLVGYTNAGKSSVLRGMSGARDVFVEDRLFATLDPLTREADLGDGYRALLTDTVGFIRKLPHQLVDAFAATLEEALSADLILHVVDASVPEDELLEMIDAVDDVLVEVEAAEQPRLLVLNKVDRLDDERRHELSFRHRDAIQVSAETGVGLDVLAEAIEAKFLSSLRRMELLVPYDEGSRLSELHDVAGEMEREDTPAGVRVRARVPAGAAARFERFSVNGQPE
jgi:GTP-binding protein HflX